MNRKNISEFDPEMEKRKLWRRHSEITEIVNRFNSMIKGKKKKGRETV